MRTRVFGAFVLLVCSGMAMGQTGYSITGGFSNFDCGNHCDDPCDEFEIEIENCRPEDILGCYHNSNYGAPRVVLSTDGTFTIIDYRNPQHLTPVNAIEHFGVSMRQLSSTNVIRVRWMRSGTPATVNGQVPITGGGSSHAQQPTMPQISADLSVTVEGGPGMALTVTNSDAVQGIWITRRALTSQGVVTLEALMPNNPAVTTTTVLDASPVYVGPGQAETLLTDMIEIEDQQSVVFAAEYFQDVGIVGPFSGYHTPGPALGNVMTATIAGPDAGCSAITPHILAQPQSLSAAAGREVQVQIDVDTSDAPVTYQWLKDGQPISDGPQFSGTTKDELKIASLGAATEGFYTVRASNQCGTILSDSAIVSITGHNIIPAPLGADVISGDQTVAANTSAFIFGSGAYAPAGTTYVWKRNGAALAEGQGGASAGGGFVTGASGTVTTLPIALEIDGVQASDAGAYTLVLTNPAGSAGSAPAALVVNAACNPADITGPGATYADGAVDVAADGQLSVEDFVVFLSAFSDATGCPGTSPCNVADIAGAGATYANGQVDIGPDGDVSIDDFIVFLSAFSDAAGCP